jgi:hypothetical protein
VLGGRVVDGCVWGLCEQAWNTKKGSITVTMTSCLTGLELSVLQIKTTIVSCHKADSKQVKLEVNCTVILPSLVFPGSSIDLSIQKV